MTLLRIEEGVRDGVGMWITSALSKWDETA
jgi:hypothetical protein